MKQILIYYINSLIMLILVLMLIMVSVAFFTLLERKMMGLFHYRKGPNKISIMGILQPFSDAMKLLSKEQMTLIKSNHKLFIMSPMFLFMSTMMLWMLYPFFTNLMNMKLSSFLFLCIMSISIYGLMFSGWSSNSSFSMLGSIRSIAQSISYEVIFSINLLIWMMINNSLNLFNLKFIQTYTPSFMLNVCISLIFLIWILAEINRTPFDLSEGESELVSGFNVEYSSSLFTLIFLAEYASYMFMMMMMNYLILYINPKNLIFYVNIIMLIYIFTWVRMTFPRMRYDKLMYLCWFYMLPIILIMFMIMMLIKMMIDMNNFNM
uniref:NADH-ubiquinone oxidoreductase chain 1 n=1 Tax=Paroligoneurus sp. QL-2014 TaxID=1491722 RepID=A0A0U1WEH3_9HYME|nr:NADH dehydrogenase subunit 1 [Paroligoneurus sp. QL-2014]